MKYIKYRPAMQKTFFYERQDGSWFACTEQEAFLQERRTSNKVRLVGVSNGEMYFSMMNEKIKEVTEKVAELEKKSMSGKLSKTRYDNAIERLNEELLQASRDARTAEYNAAKGHLERPADPNVVRSSNLSSSQQQSLNRMIG